MNNMKFLKMIKWTRYSKAETISTIFYGIIFLIKFLNRCLCKKKMQELNDRQGYIYHKLAGLVLLHSDEITQNDKVCAGV